MTGNLLQQLTRAHYQEQQKKSNAMQPRAFKSYCGMALNSNSAKKSGLIASYTSSSKVYFTAL